MRKRKRNDIAWRYCTVVDDNVGRVCCNFCGHVMWGGVTRLKHHLACIKGNVIPCKGCPPEVMAQIQEYLGHAPQKNEENIDDGSAQVSDMRGGGNEEKLQQEEEYWRKFTGAVEEFLTGGSQENEENIDGGSGQANDMRGRGIEEQLQLEQNRWQKIIGETHEYLTHGSQKNKENIDGGSEQVNGMRCGGNEEQLRLEEEYWQKLISEMGQSLTLDLRENDENIDGGSEQVNDMRGEGNEEQLHLKQECWEKSVGYDTFKYSSEVTFDQGCEARNLEYDMELERKNEEERAFEAARRDSMLTFWEDRIRRGEGCSGTKPGYGMTGYDSDDDSE